MNPLESFAMRLWTKYRLRPEDVTITESRGYWQRNEPCGGRGVCRAPIHGFMFNEGPMLHTVSITDDTVDARGRFASPFRTWNALRGEAGR